jgi:hypothetical protein
MLGGEATHGGQIGGPKLVHHGSRGWFGKRLLEERCGVGAVIVATGMALTGAVDEWVGAVGLVDNDSLEGRGVVGTQQPEACRVNEGLVEQRLVMRLRWAAAGMLAAASQFRRVKGYRELPQLARALRHVVGAVDPSTVAVTA